MTRDHDDMSAIAAAVRMVGDGWTLLIIWAAFHGITRFDSFQRKLGMARNILSNRLARLVDEGIMEKRPVQPGGRRLEYRLTERGNALRIMLEDMEAWGRHVAGNHRATAHAAE